MVAMKYTCATVLALATIGSVEATYGTPNPAEKADGVQADRYPASFPYENELYIEVPPPGKDNAIDPINAKELGGYQAHQYYYCNPFEFTPYGMPCGGTAESYSNCGQAVRYHFFWSFGIPYEVLKPFNCSAVGMFNPSLTNKGSFDGSDTVCDWEECCKGYWGTYQLTKDYIALQNRWNARFNKYGCSYISEEIYCGLILFETHWCAEQYYSGSLGDGDALARWMIMPCTNVYAYYLESCKTFKLVGAKSIAKATNAEPHGYLDEMSAAESNTVLASFYHPDRVCVPLSEIEPDMKVGAAGAPAEGAAPGRPATDAPAAPAADGTPAAAAAPAAADSAATAMSAPVFFGGLAAIFSVVRAL